jgi:hypothetical protein
MRTSLAAVCLTFRLKSRLRPGRQLPAVESGVAMTGVAETTFDDDVW